MELVVGQGRFSSKCGVSDVFHKILDMLQGLFVFLIAANITTPQDFVEAGSVYPYAISAWMLLFHLSMLFQWFEVMFSKG